MTLDTVSPARPTVSSVTTAGAAEEEEEEEEDDDDEEDEEGSVDDGKCLAWNSASHSLCNT